MAKIGSGKIKSYWVATSAYGPAAGAFDAHGRLVDAITGPPGQDIKIVRRAARARWPGVPRKKPVRFGNAKIGSGKVTSFWITSSPLGPSAVAYDARGRVVNAINGSRSDSAEVVRKAARKHWPSATERRKKPARYGNAMTARRAHVIRSSEDRYERAREAHDPKKYKRGGGYTPAETRAIATRAGISRAPSNRAKGKLEAYEFKHNPPDKVFAYYDLTKGIIKTWTGDKLGDIVWRGTVQRRMSGKVQAIRVRGINGLMYAGLCNLTGGDYCRLRRMASTRTR